jgi:hypothetical protein
MSNSTSVDSTPPPYDIPMPDEVILWMATKGWGDHHTRWHTERTWDLISPEERAAAEALGWSRYPMQEGEEGNGLDFLAMHRVMIGALKKEFPSHAALFAGWATPPIDPFQAGEELPGMNRAPFSPLMVIAIARVSRDRELARFAGDDEFGRFIQTSLSPTPKDPRQRSSDLSAGIHNYLHNRWLLADSPVNLGDFQVNINNTRFWRLHGWIDNRWQQYRDLTGRQETDVVYADALKKSAEHMLPQPGHDHDHAHAEVAHAGAEVLPPSSVPEILRAAGRRVLIENTP